MNASLRKSYTIVYEGTDPSVGAVAVCIEGIYDLNDKNVVVLDHALHAFSLVGGNRAYLNGTTVGRRFIQLATSFVFLTRGELVTSREQPTYTEESGTKVWRINVPEYGVIVVEHCGVVQYGDDMYLVSVSHPGPRVYLVVLLEIVETNPAAFREAEIGDASLCKGIIDQYLARIGAIGKVEEATTPSTEDLTAYDEC